MSVHRNAVFQLPDFFMRAARAAVSYLPSESLLGLRSISDLPRKALRRPHEPDFAVFRAFDGDSEVFVDIGANRGQSIESIRLFAPLAFIVAFEPNAHLAAHLDGRYRERGVTVHNCGVGDHDGVLELHTPQYGRTLYDTRAGTTSESAATFLSSENFLAFRPARGRIMRGDITIRTLDGFELAPTAMKVDVEGADLAVINGALATIESHLPLLMVEYPCVETERILHSLGYRSGVLDGDQLRSDTGGGLNTIFTQPSHRERLAGSGFRCD